MKEAIIKFVLSYIAGITAEQWKHALETVVEAAQLLTKDKRKPWVIEVLVSKWPKLSDSAADFLRFIAVRFAKKKGLL